MAKTKERLLSAVVSATLILTLPGYGASASGISEQMMDGGTDSRIKQLEVQEQNTAQSDGPLGADSACVGYTYGSFSGVPACVDQKGNLHICEQNFPDSAFREYVRTNFDWEGDGLLTADECSEINSIWVSSSNITSLAGVEFFTALTDLDCGNNQITELDVSNNPELTELICVSNQLTLVNVNENPELTELWCDSNQLTELDVSKNSALTRLGFGYNRLTTLDVGNNPSLTGLYGSYNELTELDVSNNPALTELQCDSNDLTGLDISNNPALTHLRCGSNQLTELDISENLELVQLWCDGNELLTLDLSNNSKLEDFRGDMYLYDFFTVTEYQDGHWVFDFSKYFTAEQLARVTVDLENDHGYIKSYDPETGLLTFTGTPGIIQYTYDTHNLNFPEMPVDVDFTIVCDHPDGAGEWEDEEPATCTHPGTQVQCCIRCGEVLNSREIPATGHSWGEWIVERPATKEMEGLQYRVCRTCGEREEAIIPVLERTPGDVTGDGEITATDARQALQAITGGALEPEQMAAADLNGDGEVTAADARLILQKVTEG